MNRSRVALFFSLTLVVFVLNTTAQSTRETTVREILGSAADDRLGPFTEYCLDLKVVPDHPPRKYVRVPCHINPSAGLELIFSNDLKFIRYLYGWELLTLENDSIVFQNSQPHGTSTHPLELSFFDARRNKVKQIYPPTPTQPVRAAFIERVAKAYKDRGDAWFREHGSLIPEMFDSKLIMSDIVANRLLLTVQYGDPDNVNDPLPFSQLVDVTCAPIDNIEKLSCIEKAQ